MPALQIGHGRIKERLTTRRNLNAANRRQTQEVKRKLETLRAALEHEIVATRDADTKHRLREIVGQVVCQLERLEREDEITQGTEAAIIEFEGAQARREKGGR